jgi:hemerythrin superfamily protein
MATQTETGTRTRSTESKARKNGASKNETSAFSFGNVNGTPAILGTLAAGAAIGIAANWGRKFLMQQAASTAAGGEWDEILKLEHKATLATFDLLLATDASDTGKRTALVKKLSYALEKHAHQEENVIYPALRQANEAVDADHLEHEHGYVKTFLYELDNMPKDSPAFLGRVQEFRDLIAEHASMEEQQVFPRFKGELTAEQNKKITGLMNKEGMKML